MTDPLRPIYMDHNATTPVDPRVLEAMLPFFSEDFGNPESSQHPFGWKAKNAVEHAREQVAGLIGAGANEITFTSGATESIYLAHFGFLGAKPAGQHLITSEAEHKATLEAAVQLKKLGTQVTFLPVNRYGQVEVSKLRAALRPETSLVSLMHANNEVGSLNPIAEIGQVLRAHGSVAFHVDAAQSVGKQAIDVVALNIDMLSLSSHKFHGPKGVGALFTRRPAVHLQALMPGGGQERGLRGGTLNVPGIVGLGKACEIAADEMPNESQRLRGWQNSIISRLVQPGGRIELNGHPTDRLCNNIHLSLGGIGSDQLLRGLSQFAVSTGSACSSGGASHVLRAMGRWSDDPLTSVVRIGLGRFTRAADIDLLSDRLSGLISGH